MQNNNDPGSCLWDRRVRRIRFLERLIGRAAVLALIFAALLTGIAAYDMYSFTSAGIKTVEYHGFDDLCSINPDTVAWIRINGTNINHPVVQGEDNYEYLDKDFYGNDYAGGSIFLDDQNDRGLTDDYIIIHGHHMSGGAMFGDLGKYMNKEFFNDHPDGALLTKDCIYKLDIVGAALADAYDSSVYYTRPGYRPDELTDRCVIKRDLAFAQNDKLIALSTCSGDMNNNRILILARARYMGKNDVQNEN